VPVFDDRCGEATVGRMSEEVFGPYRIGTLLGRGGMGEVHRAYDTRRLREVALKRLPPALAADVGFAARFRRESELAARLNDEHIIPIHDFGEIDGTLYIDMRLIEGEDLGQLLRRGLLAPECAVDIVSQIARALDAAHAAGLVHRDVKPSNVLLSRTDDGLDFCYLIDFGIARSVQGTGATALTSTGQAIGTVDYIAPERLTAAGTDRRADVYALACLLHELLTGVAPFAGADPMAVLYAHVHRPPPAPSDHPECPTGRLDAIVARGMAKNPDDRFPTAGALAAAARTALAGQPASSEDAAAPVRTIVPVHATPAPTIPTEPPIPEGSVRRGPTRRRVLLGAATVLGLAATGGTAAVWRLGNAQAPTSADSGVQAPATVVSDDLAAASPIYARMQQRGYTSLGVRGDLPAVSLRDIHGNYVGFEADIARLLAEGLGFGADRVRYSEVPSGAREEALESGSVDLCFGLYQITEQRKQRVSFAGPYLSAEQGMLVRKDETRIRRAGDLHGRKVCGVQGSLPLARIGELGLTDAPNIIETSSYSECINLLRDRQVDTLVTDDVLLKGFVTVADDLKIVADDIGFAPVAEFGIGLTRGDLALRRRLNEVLQVAITVGRWARLYDLTLGRSGVPGTPPAIEL
jgi:ABC-type amino acid transport substrate-binding protein